jgi:hypothetical protein
MASIAFFLPPKAIDKIAGDLIIVLGVLAAIIVPTMVLTATVLRGSTMTVRRVRLLTEALKQQLSFSFAFLFLIMAASAWIMLAEIAGWQFVLKLPFVGEPDFDVSWLWNAVTFLLLVLLTIRFFKFSKGLQSLLLLNSEIAEEEARARLAKEVSPIKEELEQIANKPDFGAMIGPH